MIVKKEIDFAGRKLILETGELAQQANMAVRATYGDTVVLATVVSGGLNAELDFFPLGVFYEEKLYASGTIKSSRFVKRDGRPTDEAVVTRRLIDHAIRPLFPKDFADEVQVIITVLSLDPHANPEFLAMIAASAALHASDIPWHGPMVSTKIGYIQGDYVLNPTKEASVHSELNMMVSFVGDDKRFLAIEAEAEIVPDEKVLGGIEFARNSIDELLKTIEEFAQEVNPELKKYKYESLALDQQLLSDVSETAQEKLTKALDVAVSKIDRKQARKEALEELYKKYEGVHKKTQMEKAVYEVQKKIVQKSIRAGKRPDGRKYDELRQISAQIGLLPRTHGSALFQRGETQSLTVATLGNPTMELLIQDMYGERTKRYIHYYNFPPFSTGEVGRIGAPGGREIGHGMLAEKALVPVIPNQEEFPYMILLMTEILASNGSTSMASACGSTLALMDAGVPIKDMVAGISIGLLADEENEHEHILLTDIIGLEDFNGHMDFKIAGTKDGITAIQLDMKVRGIPMELLPKIFELSKNARLQILDVMKNVISQPKGQISKYAPKMLTIKINPEKIGLVIGGGGRTIREIQEKTGAEIGIEENGNVFISAMDTESAQKAFEIVDAMTKDIKIGEVFEGVVEELADFGAFVEILPGRTGLLHVSEIVHDYVKNVADYLKVGDKVTVKVIDKTGEGKISLSKKALEPKPEGYQDVDRPQRGVGGFSGGRTDRGFGGQDRRGRDRNPKDRRNNMNRGRNRSY